IERGTLIPPTFINPLSSMYVTSSFGYRTHPTSGQANSFHTGVDLYVPTGTAVKASCGGTVTLAGWNGGYGLCVDISHGNGLVTRYGHLSSIEVSVGQTVTQGQRIALSGATGNVTGPHLHFEVRLWDNPKNPFEYLNK
ncbi:MAG: M23 family metallopeptidase, partial [Lachnospiraceae bacterium]